MEARRLATLGAMLFAALSVALTGGGAADVALAHGAATPGAGATRDARFARMITEAMHAQQIPALTVAILQSDRIVYSSAFGTADLENSVPATRETLIRTGSIAKPITAVAAMTLVESGKLNLDVPVQTYCAPFPLKQWPITTRELLGHSSGIRHYNPGEIENTHHYKWIRFAQALFDSKLLQPATLAQMWVPSAVSSHSPIPYGLGFMVRDGGRFIEHDGGQPGTSTLLFMIPTERLALALLANMEDVELHALARDIAHEMQLPFASAPQPQK